MFSNSDGDPLQHTAVAPNEVTKTFSVELKIFPLVPLLSQAEQAYMSNIGISEIKKHEWMRCVPLLMLLFCVNITWVCEMSCGSSFL